MKEDLIVAPITATGGAVAVVRLSGAGAWELAGQVFSPWKPRPRHAAYGHFIHGDDGLATPFEEGHSYTGEESVELSLHGSPASVRLLLNACLARGARLAEPGEFTLRAFMNGQMDLTQAEGVRASVEALSDAQMRQANLLRQGEMRSCVGEVRAQLVKVLAAVEAATDFEEETGPLDRRSAATSLLTAQDRINSLVYSAPGAELVREGVEVAIIGEPNVGKSSLFNALVGASRAIVTPIPGTTRDLVRAEVQYSGQLFRLTDTAGIREPTDEPERIGIGLSLEAAENADIVLHCRVAGDRPPATLGHPRTISVGTKADLGMAGTADVFVSVVTGEGLRDLRQLLSAMVVNTAKPGIVLPRHVPLLNHAWDAVDSAISSIESGAPTDLAAVHLQAAIRTLGEITGETTSADVLDQVFSQFCVGK